MSDSTAELPIYNTGKEAKWKEVQLGGGKEPLLELDYDAEYPTWAKADRIFEELPGNSGKPGDQKFAVKVDGGEYYPVVASYDNGESPYPFATTRLTDEGFPTKGQAQAAVRLAFETFLRSESKSDWSNRQYDSETGKFVLPTDPGFKK